MGAPQCFCGSFAIGICPQCERPVCGRHSRLWDDRLLCLEDIEYNQQNLREAAASEAAAEVARKAARQEAEFAEDVDAIRSGEDPNVVAKAIGRSGQLIGLEDVLPAWRRIAPAFLAQCNTYVVRMDLTRGGLLGPMKAVEIGERTPVWLGSAGSTGWTIDAAGNAYESTGPWGHGTYHPALVLRQPNQPAPVAAKDELIRKSGMNGLRRTPFWYVRHVALVQVRRDLSETLPRLALCAGNLRPV